MAELDWRSSSSEELIAEERSDLKEEKTERDRSRSPLGDDPDESLYVFELDLKVEDMAYLSEHPKKASIWMAKSLEKGKEEQWSKMSLEQRGHFDLAQAKELNNVVSSKALRALTKTEHLELDHRKVMTMRWVSTTKQDGSAKAHLVVLGFQAPNICQVQTAAPIMTKLSRNMMLSLCANSGLKIRGGDVTSAFLQADQDLESENLTVWAPAELAVMYGADASFPVMPLRIRKAFYGLVHSPRVWFEYLSATMRSIGFRQMISDRCTFALYDPEAGDIVSLAGIHVDDVLIGGNLENPLFKEAFDKLVQAYKWGKWEETEFDFAGVHVRQDENMAIYLDQESVTLKHIDEIAITPQRSSQPKLAATEKEVSMLRGAIGTIAWRSSQTSPQFQADAGLLLSEIPNATVETINKTNKLIREMKKESKQRLVFPNWNVSWKDLTIVAWADASQRWFIYDGHNCWNGSEKFLTR